VGWFLESKKINTRQYSDFIKKRIPKTSSEERKPPNTVKNLFYNDPKSFLSSINKPVYSSRAKDGVRNKTNVIDIANYLMAKSERSKRTEIKKFIGNDTIDEFWLELTKRILISFSECIWQILGFWSWSSRCSPCTGQSSFRWPCWGRLRPWLHYTQIQFSFVEISSISWGS
jgi:hypothetical protein